MTEDLKKLLETQDLSTFSFESDEVDSKVFDSFTESQKKVLRDKLIDLSDYIENEPYEPVQFLFNERTAEIANQLLLSIN